MNLTLATVRAAATGAITALAVLPLYEPHWTWIPAAIAMAGAIGIHAIPSIGQAPAAPATPLVMTNLKEHDMTEPVPGDVLMGITPPPAPKPVEAPLTPFATPVPEVIAPVADSGTPGDPEPVAAVIAPEPVPATNLAKEYLTAAIDALKEVANLL